MNRDDLPTSGEAERDAGEVAAAVETNLAAMKALLAELAPESAADALKLLRQAFPRLPLHERVQAASRFGRRP